MPARVWNSRRLRADRLTIVPPTASDATRGERSIIRATPTQSSTLPASNISISPWSLTFVAQAASINPTRNPKATDPSSCQTSG